MTKLKDLRLKSKFVFNNKPGVWKKTSSDKAECIFGEGDAFGSETLTNPEDEIFVVNGKDVQREAPVSGSGVDVIFEETDGTVLHRMNGVSEGKATLLAQMDLIAVRLEKGKRKEVLVIGDRGSDIENGTLSLEVVLRDKVPAKKKDDEKTRKVGKQSGGSVRPQQGGRLSSSNGNAPQRPRSSQDASRRRED